DGRWTWLGTEQQLPITEVPRSTALHGLVRWMRWELVDHREDQVTQRVVLRPQDGWPATLEAILTHRVDADGLTVELSVVNPGEEPLSSCYVAHPYLSAGESDVNDLVITAPATQGLQVDPERLLPGSIIDLTAGLDLRS